MNVNKFVYYLYTSPKRYPSIELYLNNIHLSTMKYSIAVLLSILFLDYGIGVGISYGHGMIFKSPYSMWSFILVALFGWILFTKFREPTVHLVKAFIILPALLFGSIHDSSYDTDWTVLIIRMWIRFEALDIYRRILMITSFDDIQKMCNLLFPNRTPDRHDASFDELCFVIVLMVSKYLLLLTGYAPQLVLAYGQIGWLVSRCHFLYTITFLISARDSGVFQVQSFARYARHPKMLQALIDINPNFHQNIPDVTAAVRQICTNMDPGMMEVLYRNNVALDGEIPDRCSAAGILAVAGEHLHLEEFLKRGVDPNTAFTRLYFINDTTPNSSHEKSMKILLRYGALVSSLPEVYQSKFKDYVRRWSPGKHLTMTTYRQRIEIQTLLLIQMAVWNDVGENSISMTPREVMNFISELLVLGCG